MTVALMRAENSEKSRNFAYSAGCTLKTTQCETKLEETLTARCNIVDVSQRTQFFYKNELLSQQALG